MGRRIRRSWVVNGAAVVVVLVAGVIAVWMTRDPAPAEPSVLVHPRIVWEPGPPQGEFEGDPWVKALRQYYVEWAVANNARDFTDTAFTYVASEAEITQIANVSRGRLDSPEGYALWLGPLPIVILDVAEEPDGRSAVVTTCNGSGWEIRFASPDAGLRDAPSPRAYQLELGSDGHRRVIAGTSAEVDDCRLENLSVGRFDPAPVPQPPGTYTRDDFRMPDFERDR